MINPSKIKKPTVKNSPTEEPEKHEEGHILILHTSSNYELDEKEGNKKLCIKYIPHDQFINFINEKRN